MRQFESRRESHGRRGLLQLNVPRRELLLSSNSQQQQKWSAYIVSIPGEGEL